MSFTDAGRFRPRRQSVPRRRVGAVAFGAAMYVLRSVPETILGAVEKIVWITVQVDSLSNEFSDVDSLSSDSVSTFSAARWRSWTAR